MKNNFGFTIIELLTTIAILVILIAISVSSFLFFQKESDLNSSSEEIINALRRAQNKTLASEGNSQYGVYFDTSVSPRRYTLFKGIDYSSRDSSFDEVHKLSKNIEIYEINLSGENEVVFARITGAAFPSGDISLRLETNPTETKTIYIEGSGLIGMTVPSVPGSSWTRDSRHVHFDLGWSIQNATTLKFNFVAAAQIETIDMADYFNAGKTEFDWEGTFLVGGVDQVFRIHTHSLDVFSTLFCVHRDRNNDKNTEEVIIFIIDEGIEKDIAHYLADADDTVNEGLYGGTKEVQ